MKATIAIPPYVDKDYCDYFTEGKEYKIIKWCSRGVFYVLDDNNDERTCRVNRSAHLDYKDWILKQ